MPPRPGDGRCTGSPRSRVSRRARTGARPDHVGRAPGVRDDHSSSVAFAPRRRSASVPTTATSTTAPTASSRPVFDDEPLVGEPVPPSVGDADAPGEGAVASLADGLGAAVASVVGGCSRSGRTGTVAYRCPAAGSASPRSGRCGRRVAPSRSTAGCWAPRCRRSPASPGASPCAGSRRWSGPGA